MAGMLYRVLEAEGMTILGVVTTYILTYAVKKVRARMNPMESVRCIIPSCYRSASNQPAHRRMCLQCYGAAKKKVERDETSWEELEDLGLAGKGAGATPLEEALAKARAEARKKEAN